MKICPKCKEAIGETLYECPFCKYQFSKEDIERFKREKEEAELGEAKKLEELRAKRAKMRVIYFIVMMSFYILPYGVGGLIASMTKSFNVFVYAAISAMVLGTAVMIIGIINGAFRCPYCGSLLFRNYGKYCSKCGKQLYY